MSSECWRVIICGICPEPNLDTVHREIISNDMITAIAKNSKSKIKKVVIVAVLTIMLALVVCGGAALIWISGYYEPSDVAIESLNKTNMVEFEDENYYIFVPEGEIKAGIVLYPGAKVDYKAYAPLADKLAENGYACAVVKVPLNMAMLDKDAAETVVADYPDIRDWYVGGHSLGAATAGMEVKDNPSIFKGIIFLAGYTTVDISKYDMLVLSIYGSNDRVLSLDKYNENRENLPRLNELVIEGGNHAQFGSYGAQKGDGEASISEMEQVNQTAEFIVKCITEK